MRQKGFATILSLCLILVIALIVKGIQESETNHAREVLNFEMEQALQSAAESGIVEAAEKIRIADEKPDETSDYYLPYTKTEAEGIKTYKKNLPVDGKIFYHDEQEISIEVEVWGERGEIYFCPEDKNYVYEGESKVGVYLMSCATIKDEKEKIFFGEKIYRRAYAYFLDEDNTKINFMELPTQHGDSVKKYDKKPTN